MADDKPPYIPNEILRMILLNSNDADDDVFIEAGGRIAALVDESRVQKTRLLPLIQACDKSGEDTDETFDLMKKYMRNPATVVKVMGKGVEQHNEVMYTMFSRGSQIEIQINHPFAANPPAPVWARCKLRGRIIVIIRGFGNEGMVVDDRKKAEKLAQEEKRRKILGDSLVQSGEMSAESAKAIKFTPRDAEFRLIYNNFDGKTLTIAEGTTIRSFESHYELVADLIDLHKGKLTLNVTGDMALADSGIVVHCTFERLATAYRQQHPINLADLSNFTVEDAYLIEAVNFV